MYIQKLKGRNFFKISFCWRLEGQMTKIAGSRARSICQRHGSANPDPYQNIMDPHHWNKHFQMSSGKKRYRYRRFRNVLHVQSRQICFENLTPFYRTTKDSWVSNLKYVLSHPAEAKKTRQNVPEPAFRIRDILVRIRISITGLRIRIRV